MFVFLKAKTVPTDGRIHAGDEGGGVGAHGGHCVHQTPGKLLRLLHGLHETSLPELDIHDQRAQAFGAFLAEDGRCVTELKIVSYFKLCHTLYDTI